MSDTDPPRLLDLDSDASPAARALLGAAPRVPPLSDAVRAASAARVAELAAGSAGVWLFGRFVSRGGLVAGGAGGLSAVILTVTLATTQPWAPRRTPLPAHARAAPTAVTAVLPVAALAPPPTARPPVAAPPPASEPAPPPPAAAAHLAPRRHAPAAAPTAPADESAMLEDARAALVSRRDPRAALALVRAHERAFPRSQYTEEREFVRVRAHAAAGDRARARQLARAFVARYPGGSYTEQVRALLAADAP